MILEENREEVIDLLNKSSQEDKEMMLIPEGMDFTAWLFFEHMFIAKVEGEVVGCAALIIDSDEIAQASIYVIPEHRGGKGYLLIKALDEEARKLGAKHIFSPVKENNENMLYLCNKHGLSTYPSEIDGTVLRGKEL